jgi:CRP/FNR family nitrogen fixation transcriptional regulator
MSVTYTNGQSLGAADYSFSQVIEPYGAKVAYARQVEIFGENESSEYFYKVISGSVRAYKVLDDGRRQVCAFYMPGDFFGWETNGKYSVSVDTISDTKVLVIKRKLALSLAEDDARVARSLWSMTGTELERTRAHVLLLVKTSRERVAAFLLEMSERSNSPDQFDLPMSRQDIADYLGLTIETVSRALTEMENAFAIALPASRRIVLRNREALIRLSA